MVQTNVAAGTPPDVADTYVANWATLGAQSVAAPLNELLKGAKTCCRSRLSPAPACPGNHARRGARASTPRVEAAGDLWVAGSQPFLNFMAYYALDAGNGVIASVSLFADRAGAAESTRRAAEWVRRELSGLVPNPPQVTEGDVRVERSQMMRRAA